MPCVIPQPNILPLCPVRAAHGGLDLLVTVLVEGHRIDGESRCCGGDFWIGKAGG